MKGHGHHAIRQVEGFLNTVAVVHVNVDVQHPGMVLEQFQYGDHDVVDVTESGRFEFFRVMQTARPVDSDIAAVLVQLHGSVQRRAGVHGTEIVQALEHGTVFAHVEMVQVLAVRGQVLRRDPLQELNVLVVVEPAHVLRAGPVRPVDFHFIIQTVVQHQAVYDGQTVRLHRMRRPVMEIAHVRVVEIKHAFVGHVCTVGGGGAVGDEGRLLPGSPIRPVTVSIHIHGPSLRA